MIAYHPRAYLPWAARTAVRASSHCDCHSETQGHKRWLALREGDDLVGSRPSNSTHQLNLFSTFFKSIKTPKWVWDVFFPQLANCCEGRMCFHFFRILTGRHRGQRYLPSGRGRSTKGSVGRKCVRFSSAASLPDGNEPCWGSGGSSGRPGPACRFFRFELATLVLDYLFFIINFYCGQGDLRSSE